MCGIAGFVGRGDARDLRAMTDSMVHRGPDGEGFHIDEASRVHLGHRRLAIVDLADGAQPMWNEDESIGVVFNGEIYNHAELRRELSELGHRFRTNHSDTEVLVHGYEEWGENLPRRLNGMFAFAIYDHRQHRLFLARDRFGEKPLYYAIQKDLFLFASELSAFSKHRFFSVEIDRRSLKKFFAHAFIPSPNSLLKDARKLPAGGTLVWDIVRGTAREDVYWRFQIDPGSDARPEQELAAELRFLLVQAVQRRLMADVPLGIFLSGGIDSTAILAAAAMHVPPDELQSFSIGFTERSYDESPFARSAAQAIGCRHHERVLDLDGARRLAGGVLSELDEPLGDPSLLPTWMLAGFASERVKVALGGDGGDELFAGYDPFAALNVARLYRAAVPQWIHHLIRQGARLLPVSSRNMAFDFKLRRALAGVAAPPQLWNPLWMAPLQPGEIAELFGEACDPEDLYSEAIAAWTESQSPHLVDRTLEFFTKLYLADDILTKVDRATMMHSLEARAPFLDVDLVEFVRRLPHSMKYRRGVRKYLLKKALEGLVPQEILRRPKKGFGLPLVAWMKQFDPVDGGAESFGMSDAWARAQWNEHASGRADHRQFLWCWFVLHHYNAAPLAAAA